MPVHLKCMHTAQPIGLSEDLTTKCYMHLHLYAYVQCTIVHRSREVQSLWKPKCNWLSVLGGLVVNLAKNFKFSYIRLCYASPRVFYRIHIKGEFAQRSYSLNHRKQKCTVFTIDDTINVYVRQNTNQWRLKIDNGNFTCFIMLIGAYHKSLNTMKCNLKWVIHI